MPDLIGTMVFSLIMGFSIYLSLPILFHKKTGEKTLRLLNAAAIGILVFLMADVFSDAAAVLYAKGSLYGYGASPVYSAIFAASLALGFFMLYYFENRVPKALTPSKTALMIASGIGLQNLTEGLVFGALSASIGLFSGVSLVVLTGFILQNITEGFPIASPFMGQTNRQRGKMLLLFLVGGVPTIIGGLVGFFYSSPAFNIFFEGLAIGAILYVILPMTKHLLKDIDPIRQKAAYAGIFIGFLVGFLVNLI